MSLRAQIKKEGEYPSSLIFKRETLKLNNKTIILSTSETERAINIYLGGIKHWCIHSELIKENGKIKEEGYLVKIRYDMLCSVEENIKHGGDISKLLKLLIQHLHKSYPTVKYLLFNDLSTRRCDNGYDTNLAVMTYLYTEKTWYEKNFGAELSQQSEDAFKDIIKKFTKSKKLSWDIIKSTIHNYKQLPYTELELETLYNNSTTWKDFFEPIEDKIKIAEFCIFVSSWLDSFILKYFNNLMGLTYKLPIKSMDIEYIKNVFEGGRYKSFFKGARKNRTIKRYTEME